MREEIDHRTGNANARRKIVQAALQLYCEIGHSKTTVSDIARRLSMSSANVYRFFPSKLAIEEAVVAEVLDATVSAATEAARTQGPALRRLATILKAIADCNEGRSAKHRRLQDLVALAVRQNWPSSSSTTTGFAGWCDRSSAPGRQAASCRAVVQWR
jgi:AcrR family transcriptional regulator